MPILPVCEHVDHREGAGHGAETEPNDIGEDVLVPEDLGILVFCQLAQEGVGLAQEQVDQQPEHFLKFWYTYSLETGSYGSK